MLNYDVVFENAWYLLLLVPLVPAVWWLSRGSLAGLGRVRRMLAIGLRLAVLLLIVAALAGMQLEKSSDRVTVIYLLDQSLSIPQEQRQAMLDYVNEAVRRHHEESSEDKVGVIVFGRDAAVEYPPADYFAGLAQVETTDLEPEHTNLAGAMKRAMAMFTGDYAKRIVVVSDGNENVGDARREARALADASVSIDVWPVFLPARNEISVEKVAVPADVRRDQPFDLRVVVDNESSDKDPSRTVRGKLRIVRKTGERDETIAEQDVELPPGKRVLRISEVIERADFYTYEAIFVPDDPAEDGASQNNSATTFTHVRGRGHVLLIEDFAEPGQFDYLVDRLQSEGLEVTVQQNNRMFTSLPELQRYDTVILANVPRSSGETADEIAHFSDDQITMLVRNTEMGCGLIMLGGPNSFGAGGWTSTDLERAMPVDFTIKSKKISPVGALVLMMHAGEIPQANYWQKRIAVESVKALGYQDYCGLVQWNGTDQWLWAASQGGMMQVGPNRQRMLSRVDRMTIGDMPAFDPAMNMAAAAFQRLDNGPEKPAVKHMIIISDGDPTPPTAGTMNQLISLGVKVSTVAVGSHGILGSGILQRIATQTGGKYYVVRSANALPRIYQREVRRVAQPLIYEKQYDIAVQQRMQHEMLKGIDGVPPVHGFVMTSVKPGALPEILLTATEPMEENATILAGWQFGLGKAVAFTTDAGRQPTWAANWAAWEGFDSFFSQMVRWSMRPLGDTGKYTVSSMTEQGQTQVVVTALDQNDELLNYQTMSGIVVGPNMNLEELKFRQVAPGRYMAQFASEEAGSYSISVSPGVGQGQILTGVNVGYSDEYQDRQTNLPLLESMASLQARGGQPGRLVLDDPATPATDERLEANPFRRDLPEAKSIQDIWPLLVFLGSFVFFADVFVRRVQVGFEWVRPVAARARDFVLRREPAAQEPETMSRLRSRKAEVDHQIEHRRATARFEAEPDAPADPSVLDEARKPTAPPARPTQGRPAAAADQEEETYTSRLLKAKKDVWKDRNK